MRWRKIEEEKPEENQYVLIWTHLGGVEIDRWLGDFFKHRWSVRYWMPLPTPPE